LAHEELAGDIVIVESDGTTLDPSLVRSLPALLVADHQEPVADVIADATSLGDIIDAMRHHPNSALALTLLLRGSEERSVDDGLVAESLTYSMLQGGAEFANWQRGYRQHARLSEIGSAVRIESAGATTRLTLSRPHLHNAFDRRMRDELCDALAVVLNDPDCETLEIRGSGPSFCSGGDLSEFGSFPDSSGTHGVRLARHPARLMARLAERTTVFLHGACLGAGIELPAFAGRVVADPSTSIALPEIALGLVPGAGGTVSLPRRIGRQRTAWLALTGARLDATTALAWGLVDAIDDVTPG
jgi:enoyl-CoA hydratase/carnithine racemase